METDWEGAIRQAAAAVAAAEADLAVLKKNRNQTMRRARNEARMTWRSIAAAAGMTEMGVRRAVDSLDP